MSEEFVNKIEFDALKQEVEDIKKQKLLKCYKLLIKK